VTFTEFMGEMRNAYKIIFELSARNHMEDRRINGMMILKWMLKN
jgi:hypothetical protein